MSMIEAICLSPEHGAPQQEAAAAQVHKLLGLLGDRYSGSAPAIVSFIAADEVEAFNRRTGLSVNAKQTGRNLVTRGVDLNSLVGKRFKVADVEFEGMELCEPCSTLGARLATGDVSAARIVRELTHKAGIRAYVRSGGELKVGDLVEAG